jgi:glycosyltransferase involved in cell wall biosynthesis
LPEEVVNGVMTYRVGLEKKRATTLRYIFEYFYFFAVVYLRVRKLVRTNHYDIVHVHTIPDFLVFAAHPARRRGAKVIIDMHEIWPEFFMSKYGIGEKHVIIRLLKYIERISLEYADYVITVNKQLKTKFENRARIRNGIVEIMNTASDDTMSKLPKVNTGKFIAIYHGTLTTLYNLDFAVNAIETVADKLDNFEFHIYGDGPELENLREMAKRPSLKGTVVVHGRVKYSEIPPILATAQLGILPMKKDVMSDLSFSNKIAEYVYNEIPVLSSNLAGVMEYFPGDTVYYYSNGDSDAFTKQLLHIYQNAEERQAYARRALEVNKRISWDVMKGRLQNLVALAMGEKKAQASA